MEGNLDQLTHTEEYRCPGIRFIQNEEELLYLETLESIAHALRQALDHPEVDLYADVERLWEKIRNILDFPVCFPAPEMEET